MTLGVPPSVGLVLLAPLLAQIREEFPGVQMRVLEGFSGDAIPANNEALTLVDVRGRLRLLLVEGDASEAGYLTDAMEKEGIQLESRAPNAIPATPQELGGYDGVILSDVPAHKVGERAMTAPFILTRATTPCSPRLMES